MTQNGQKNVFSGVKKRPQNGQKWSKMAKKVAGVPKTRDNVLLMTSGGEEVWDFMRLGIGQGGGCGSKGLSEIDRRSASRSMSGNIPHNGLK